MDWGLRLPDLRRSHAPLLVNGELVVSGGSTMLCAPAGTMDVTNGSPATVCGSGTVSKRWVHTVRHCLKHFEATG